MDEQTAHELSEQALESYDRLAEAGPPDPEDRYDHSDPTRFAWAHDEEEDPDVRP